jgi:hypothetical protein
MGFEDFTVAKFQIVVLRVISPCSWQHGYQQFGKTCVSIFREEYCTPKDGDIRFLQKVGNHAIVTQMTAAFCFKR